MSDAEEIKTKQSKMKTIGLLGGMSYPSTIPYYKLLNEFYRERLGPLHSCPIILYSIDYYEIMKAYKNDWKSIPALLKTEIESLLAMQPDCYMLCNNTLHKAYNEIEMKVKSIVPFFHLIDLTIEHLQNKSMRNVLLLGTEFTMTDGYFARPLEKADINVVIPKQSEREKIEEIQTRMAANEMKKSFSDYFQSLVMNYQHLDGIILACTELPLAFESIRSDSAIINTAELQCRKAIEYITAIQ